ncbi:MAG: hypothetical protein R3B51_08720 [Thermodesulfobacteriota bacterium]
MLDVANHMDALTPAERRRFDAEALKLRRPGEPDPGERVAEEGAAREAFEEEVEEGRVKLPRVE